MTTADGAIALTLVRAVGWLSRHDLRTRPGPPGPAPTRRARSAPARVEARLALFAGLEPSRRARRRAAAPRRAAAATLRSCRKAVALLALEPHALVLSALKPAEDGDGLVVRVLNPTDAACEAVLRLGFSFTTAEPVRLDEAHAADPVTRSGDTLRFAVPPHALRSVRIV